MISVTVQNAPGEPDPESVDVQVDRALRAVQVEMDLLGEEAAMKDRMAAVRRLGFSVGHANQDGRDFSLSKPGGGLFAVAAMATGQLSTSGIGNTFAFDVPVEQGQKVRCVYDLEFQRVTRWVLYQSGGLYPQKSEKPHVRAPGQPVPRLPRASQPPAELPSADQALEAFRSADSAMRAAKDAFEDALRKEGLIRSTIQDCDRQIARLRERMNQRLGDEVLAGREIADNPPEVSKIAKLRIKRDASAAALPLAEERTAQAKSEIRPHLAARVEAVLDWSAAEQARAMSDLHASLASALPSLGRLAAIDRAKTAVIGSAATTGRGNHPGLFASERLVAKLLKELPDVARPAELKSERVQSEIQQVTAALLQQMGAKS